MKAAVLYAPGSPLAVEEVDLDPPRSGEVLVRLVASGICRSDLHIARGVHPAPLPIVLGHEGAGIVEALGEGVSHVRPGDHVVLSWLPYCGRCRWCRAGRPNLCGDLAWSDAGLMRDRSTRLHRGELRIHHNTSSTFAERTVVPAETAIPVDPSLPLAEVVLLGCAVLTGVGAVLSTARVRPGQSVAVIGCGGVGLSVVQGAAIAGADPIVAVDVAPSRLETARALGATHAVAAGAGAGAGAAAGSPRAGAAERIAGVRRAVREVVDGVDYVFEALGEVETIEMALALAGRGGTVVLIGLAPPSARVPIDPLTMTFEERTITGCLYGSCIPDRDIPKLLSLYRSGRLRLDAMIGGTCGLEGINDAFARIESGEGGRTIVVFG
jgi:Zn-dependent alcohol dehydrogenase